MNTTESLDQINMRRSNLSLVLSELIRRPRSRAQLAVDITMTRGAVGSLVGELIARGLVEISKPKSSGGVGRPGQIVTPVSGRARSIGISYSPPWVIGVSVDPTGSVVAHERRTLSGQHPTAEELVAHTQALVTSLGEAGRLHGDRSPILAGVAVAVPDLVDARSGVVRRSPTLGLVDYPLEEVLRAALAEATTTLAIDNDANYGALAESRARRLGPRSSLLYLTGSTAMGAGILVDGEPLRGAAGFAGEVGHMLIDPDGRECVCGSRGCWEAEIGLRTFLELATDPRSAKLDQALDGDDLVATIARRAEAGDPRALGAVQHVGMYLGLGLASLINIFNPDTVILGGYFIRIYHLLLQPVRRIVHQRVLAERLAECQILRSDLDMYAGAIGAGVSMMDRLIADPMSVPLLAPTQQGLELQAG